MKTLTLVLATIALLSGTPVAQAFQATPTASACEGLIGYMRVLSEAAQPYGSTMQEEGLAGRDVTTYSATEWTAFAEAADEVQTALKKLEPPPGLASWHQFQIERWGFLSALGRSAASIGLVATGFGLSEQSEQIESDLASETIQAGFNCPGFANTAKQWAGTSGAAATPTATPEG